MSWISITHLEELSNVKISHSRKVIILETWVFAQNLNKNDSFWYLIYYILDKCVFLFVMTLFFCLIF